MSDPLTTRIWHLRIYLEDGTLRVGPDDAATEASMQSDPSTVTALWRIVLPILERYGCEGFDLDGHRTAQVAAELTHAARWPGFEATFRPMRWRSVHVAQALEDVP